MTQREHEALSEKPTGELTRELDETRARLREEARGVAQKLSPSHIKERVKESVVTAKDDAVDRVRERAGAAGRQLRHAGSTAGSFVQENPIPVAMIGIGLGWLALSTWRSRRSRDEWRPPEPMSFDDDGQSRDWRNEARQRMHDAGERVHAARGRVAESASRAREGARHAYQHGRERAVRARGQLEHGFEQNPLAYGAVALAAGAGLALLLPETERENELLGERRDELMLMAKERMHEAADIARHTAREAAHSAGEAARDVSQTARNEARREAARHGWVSPEQSES